MKLLAKIWPYVRRRAAAYTVGISLVALGTCAGAAVPLIIGLAIDAIRKGHGGKAVLYGAIGIVAFAALRGVLHVGGRMMLLTTARRVEYELRNDIFARLLRLPQSYFGTHPSGDITSRVINDLEGLRLMVGLGITSVISTGLLLAASLIGMFTIDWTLTLLALIPMTVVSVITAATGPAMHRRSLSVQDQLGVISSRAQENFTGARVIRAFAQEDSEIARYRAECDVYLRANISLARLRGGTYALLTFFTELSIATTLWIGGRGLLSGTFSEGSFAAFTAYQFMLVWPMIAIGWTVTIVQRGLACMGRIAEILDAEQAPTGGEAQGVNFAGRIEIRDLTFRYDESREPALSNLSMTIEGGQKVAIVGRTGSGKSTIGALLMRLYPAPRGSMLIDGRDVNDIGVAEQRRAIGCVPQDPFLFSDTLRENIAFGGAGDAVQAATLSRIAADAERFPGKLDQMIGERGVTLSGGQKQRTALARAIVRNPSILILDDALSSVDAHTERQILDALREIMKGRTSIVITHRLPAIRDADRIYVLDGGKLAESGSHDELMARRALYAEMWERQQLVDQLSTAP